MAQNLLLDDHFQHYKTIIDDIFRELHELTVGVKNNSLSKTVDNIRSRLNEPFLFVIVGEVKVGKSSFVNALLESKKEICKVAPDPCTDVIQQIVYSETEAVIPVSEYLKKITLPIDILKKIAIVDTPGTNTIVEHHAEITEKFIPVSDLIIFVFEAKNPYRQSAWEFLDFINKEWKKKVIFILQQSDLMEPDDLTVNIAGVTKQAIKKGIPDPKVFAVSAKMEQNGDTENSGFIPVREYVRETVTGGNNVRMKLTSLLSTSKKIMLSIFEGITLRQQQLEVDQTFRSRVSALLDNAEQKSSKQVDGVVTDLLREYDKVTAKIQKDFERGLGVFTLIKKSFLSVFSSGQTIEDWLEGITKRFEKELKPALEKKLKEGIVHLAESIKQMAEIIDLEIKKTKPVLKDNTHLFGDIAYKRQEKLEKLQMSVEEFIAETETFINTDVMRESSSIAPNMATGGLAMIGGLLTAIAGGTVFDITGGILAGLGLFFAGGVVTVKRGRIIREFEEEIAKGREKLKEQVLDKLNAYVGEIRTKIDNNFLEFDTFISGEASSVNEFASQYESIASKFRQLVKDLELEV